jgi:NADH-quinone oxidoreductase subunit L
LKRHLPVTYWTFLVGALAIAGVPGLAGFFSKDEILFRTFAGGHQLLWLVGLLTSLLTAVYMFRLVFLAFHGSRRTTVEPVAGGHDVALAPAHAEEEEPAAHAAEGHSGSATHLHDAPPAMALALIVLAVGSVFAGYIGLPHALGGSNRLEQFLAPSFAAGHAEGGHAAADEALERGLMLVSTVVAAAGIGLAVLFFLRNRSGAERLRQRFAGVHRVLTNKYYVDEIYDATIVQPVRIVSEEGLWKRLDVRVIDGAVNGVADTVGGMGELLRRFQTGSVRAYAASVFIGVVCVLGYYLLM